LRFSCGRQWLSISHEARQVYESRRAGVHADARKHRARISYARKVTRCSESISRRQREWTNIERSDRRIEREVRRFSCRDDGPRDSMMAARKSSAYPGGFHRTTRARRERVDNRVYSGNFPPLTDTRDEISRENSIRYFSRAWSRCQAMR